MRPGGAGRHAASGAGARLGAQLGVHFELDRAKELEDVMQLSPRDAQLARDRVDSAHPPGEPEFAPFDDQAIACLEGGAEQPIRAGEWAQLHARARPAASVPVDTTTDATGGRRHR